MDYHLVFITVFINVLMLRSGQCYTEQSQDVCHFEAFQAQCPRGEIIIITQALYGHIGVSRCIESPREGLRCKADVVDIMSARCDGQSECSIEIDDPDIRVLQPCSRGIYMYLTVSHMCIPAKPAKLCQPVSVTNAKTFISSKQILSQACPGPATAGGSQYLLTTTPGRSIQVSSIGFSSDDENSMASTEVGYLLDEGTEEITPLSIRPDGGRERVLMTSDSNRATLSIHQGSNINFLLFFKASGCEDMQQPKDMWLDRDQDELTVGCLNSRKSWSLRCEGDHWRGVIGNCTAESLISVAEIRVIEEITMALPRDSASIAVTASHTRCQSIFFHSTEGCCGNDVVLMIIFAATAVLALIIVTSGYVSYRRSAIALVTSQPELALLHNDIERKTSASNASNKGPVPSIPQGPQYTLMRLQENPSQQQPPPVPPRKDNYSAQTTLNLRDH